VSGLDVAPYDAAARQLGVRIISPNRPGMGGSSPQPGRTTLDWARDVGALLNGLGLPRASVLGWSMGGQYALACGAQLADRVDRVVVIAGAIPLDDLVTFGELNQLDQRLTSLANDRARVARIVLGSMRLLARHMPREFVREAVKDAVPLERSAVRNACEFLDASREALAHADGMIEEYRAWSRPWGFAPEDVRVPTEIWQGDADTFIPRAWGETLSKRIPDATLELRPGEGHFLGYVHPSDVLRSLFA
jgi:pimeloyl-ACP methyl ester carboxylesterase